MWRADILGVLASANALTGNRNRWKITKAVFTALFGVGSVYTTTMLLSQISPSLSPSSSPNLSSSFYPSLSPSFYPSLSPSLTNIPTSTQIPTSLNNPEAPIHLLPALPRPENSLGVERIGQNSQIFFYNGSSNHLECKPAELALIKMPTPQKSLAVKESIAMCVVEAQGVFFYHALLRNMIENAVNPLRRNASLDVFIHLFKEPSADDRSMACVPRKSHLAMLFEEIKPVSLKIFNWSSCDEYRRQSCALCCIESTAFMQLGWTDNCFNEAKTFRNKQDLPPYTWFIRTRPDVAYYAHLPRLETLSRWYVYTAPKLDAPPQAANHDMFFMFSDLMMKAWWGQWSEKIRVCGDDLLFTCCPEFFIYSPLKYLNATNSRWHERVSIVIDACLLSDIRLEGRCWGNERIFTGRTSHFWGSQGAAASLDGWHKRLSDCLGNREKGDIKSDLLSWGTLLYMWQNYTQTGYLHIRPYGGNQLHIEN